MKQRASYQLFADIPPFLRRHDLACRQPGVDPAAFFPAADGSPERQRRAEQAAAGICAGCPAVDECAAWALATCQDHGVWGGLTPADRQRIRARRAAA